MTDPRGRSNIVDEGDVWSLLTPEHTQKSLEEEHRVPLPPAGGWNALWLWGTNGSCVLQCNLMKEKSTWLNEWRKRGDERGKKERGGRGREEWRVKRQSRWSGRGLADARHADATQGVRPIWPLKFISASKQTQTVMASNDHSVLLHASSLGDAGLFKQLWTRHRINMAALYRS